LLIAMPTVTFVNEKKTIEVPAGANLRKEARKAGVQLYPFPHNIVNCMGLGLCTSCRVIIKKGVENCSRQGVFEKASMNASMLTPPFTFFARLGHEHDLRLACQTTVNGDIEVETKPSLNWHGEKFWG
jgi:ferredoxin